MMNVVQIFTVKCESLLTINYDKCCLDSHGQMWIIVDYQL